jgi:hypothetical protein
MTPNQAPAIRDRVTVAALDAYGFAAASVPADTDVYADDLNAITTTYLGGRHILPT